MDSIPWNDDGLLYVVHVLDGGEPRKRADLEGPLNYLVEMAMRHVTYRDIEVRIELHNGKAFDRGAIRSLFKDPSRPPLTNAVRD